MKAILEFNLPEDQAEYQLANDASNMYHILWEMKQWLRTMVKYAPDEISEDTYNTFVECRDKLNRLLLDNKVDLEV